MDRDELKRELKKMLIDECQKDLEPEQIADDAILIGDESGLDFDSLDALQISMAVQQRYGKRIEGNGPSRRALTSVNTLADFIVGKPFAESRQSRPRLDDDALSLQEVTQDAERPFRARTSASRRSWDLAHRGRLCLGVAPR